MRSRHPEWPGQGFSLGPGSGHPGHRHDLCPPRSCTWAPTQGSRKARSQRTRPSLSPLEPRHWGSWPPTHWNPRPSPVPGPGPRPWNSPAHQTPSTGHLLLSHPQHEDLPSGRQPEGPPPEPCPRLLPSSPPRPGLGAPGRPSGSSLKHEGPRTWLWSLKPHGVPPRPPRGRRPCQRAGCGHCSRPQTEWHRGCRR